MMPPKEGRSEQLWARQVSDQRFEICCIPFLAYDLALGDVVETTVEYEVVKVVKSSGRSVFRIWFGDSFHPRTEIADELEQGGALLEWSSTNLLAVDAADESDARRVEGLLVAHARAGHLNYERGGLQSSS